MVHHPPRFPLAKGNRTMQLALSSLFLCCCGAIAFLSSHETYITWAARGVPIFGPPKGSASPQALSAINGTDLNWTSCPTLNELRTQRLYSLWDEKLAQALSRSPLGAPKTEQESWHAVTNNIHAFTAFLTSKPKHAIYIVSLVRRNESSADETEIQRPPLVCLIRTSNGTIQRKARIREVWTWLNPDFKNALIVCPPPSKKGTAAEDMKVAAAVRGSAGDSVQWLQLHRVPVRADEKCCAVCVRPTYGSSVSLWKIVEFIIHYKLMGVTKFYFYDLDMPLDMKLLLAWLQYNGVEVTLVPFKLIADIPQVHAHGQMPGLYDCIFRSMAKTEYYIHVDVDELIIPRKHSTIGILVEKMERKRHGLGSVLIPARYFCVEYPLNMRYFDVDRLPLQTRLFTYHFEEMLGVGFSKYIARSRTVSEPGVHNVRVHHKGYSMVDAESSLVFMNHYRRCCKFPPDHAVVQLKLDLRNFSRVPDDYSFVELSARIENDGLVRALKNLLK